jgi:2,3-dihydroxybiphenyl 1,2-dioxygenase
MTAGRVACLGYLVWGAREPRALHRFLADGLGMQPAPAGASDEADAMGYRMDARACRWLAVRSDTDGLAAIGLEVADLAALRLLTDELVRRGIEVEAGSDAQCRLRGVDALVRVTDPAGHVVELYAHGRELSAPFVSPAGSAFVTDPHGIGHVVLSAPSLDEAEHFYVDALGFRRSDILDLRGAPVSFLHCNARHHTVALAGIPGERRVLHAMVEMRSLDEVGYAQDRLAALGFTLRRSLGRHSNDRMLSFYVDGPARLQMEVGWGGLLVDDATWRVTRITTASLWGHHDLPPKGAA